MINSEFSKVKSIDFEILLFVLKNQIIKSNLILIIKITLNRAHLFFCFENKNSKQ